MKRTLLPGRPYPLGATVYKNGTNFAIFSQDATRVDLCLFDENGKQTDCVTLREHTAFVWHGQLLDIRPGQLYGYRIDGPWDPENGQRFNFNKLLVDPYANAIAGEVDWKAPIFPYDLASGDDTQMDKQDSAAGVPKCVVVDQHFDWGDDAPPETPLADSVIYEMHVRGFSMRNSQIPKPLRGTYAGLAHESSIDYLKKLGVTAVELLPVHHFIDEGHLVDKGLRDYWGYNTLGFFAPMSRYSSSGDNGGQVREFKEMVKALHSAGIEVLLDVVYNHTCEGNHMGPVLSWKGVCNTTYYRAVEGSPRFYMDYTGTGNTLNVRNPQVLKMLMDSLRFWVTEMHVDGFRFDLAELLGVQVLKDIEVALKAVKPSVILIAEPWSFRGHIAGALRDTGWASWNDGYRNFLKDYVRGNAPAERLEYFLRGSPWYFAKWPAHSRITSSVTGSRQPPRRQMSGRLRRGSVWRGGRNGITVGPVGPGATASS